jgi:hypothetical protein
LRGSPPPKPTRLPSAPITRWQGTTIAIGAHRLGPGRLADRLGDVAVGAGLAVRDLGQLAPHGQLEAAADRPQRQVEVGPLTGEVLAELADDVVEPFVGPLTDVAVHEAPWRRHGQPDEALALSDHGQRTDRRVHDGVRPAHGQRFHTG